MSAPPGACQPERRATSTPASSIAAIVASTGGTRRSMPVQRRSGASHGAAMKRSVGCWAQASTITPLGADELLVRHAVRPVGLGAELVAPPGLVGLEVPLEPRDLRVALEGEHVGGDAVEEPPVVGDDHRAAREGEERLLERAE